MQECFKKYPEIYGAELADDEDGAPTPDFGDEQPSGAPTTAEFKSDGAPAREFGEKAAADTTKSGDSKKTPEPKTSTPPKNTSTSSKSATASSKSTKEPAKTTKEPAGDSQRTAEYKSDGEPAREFGHKAAADTTQTSSQSETNSVASGSRMVQDVATPIEEPVNEKYWQDMHKSKVAKQDIVMEPTQAHDATAANEEIKIIEKEEAAKKKKEAEKKQ